MPENRNIEGVHEFFKPRFIMCPGVSMTTKAQELAQEHIEIHWLGLDPNLNAGVKKAFLAGYEAAEKNRQVRKCVECGNESMSNVGIHIQSKLDTALVALRFYAKGKSNEPNTRTEFGCGCCAGNINGEGDNDYDDSVIGETARSALAEIEGEK